MQLSTVEIKQLHQGYGQGQSSLYPSICLLIIRTASCQMSAWGKLLHIFRHVLHTFIYVCNWHLICVFRLSQLCWQPQFHVARWHFLFCFVRIVRNIHFWQLHITLGRHQAVVQSPGSHRYSHQAVIWQLPCSHKTVVKLTLTHR